MSENTTSPEPQDENQLIAERREKLSAMRARQALGGPVAFPNDFKPAHHAQSLHTAHGEFTAHAFRDQPSQALHLALVKGSWTPETEVPVRVHEPLSVLDALEVNRAMHSWSLDASLQYLNAQGCGVAVLLNCGETADQLMAQFEGRARSAQAPERGKMDLRTYGVGAQILRECGVHKMKLMGQPRRMPSMMGYGLEITGYIPKE
jgi:3,4-dihydroxy 2-butanone 4-phosphate synthase/GTP cyclohydrolase II